MEKTKKNVNSGKVRHVDDSLQPDTFEKTMQDAKEIS